jgi:hypothetical protein
LYGFREKNSSLNWQEVRKEERDYVGLLKLPDFCFGSIVALPPPSLEVSLARFWDCVSSINARGLF